MRVLAFPILLALSACAPRPERVAAPTPAATAVRPEAPEPPPTGLVRGAAQLARVPWAGEGSAGTLLDVVAIAPGEALAVGEPGVVHVRGDRVEVAPLPDGIPTSVWADGTAFAVAVGYGGISHVREGAGPWKPLATGTDADLLAVWGRVVEGRREVFAGGARGTLLRLDGGAWERVAAPESAHLSAFAGSAGVVWALGETSGGAEGVILRSSGAAFRDACPELACGGAIYDGWSPVPGELWTVGGRGEVVRYVGVQAEWISAGVTGDLTGIWGTGTKDLFVIGDEGAVRHWDGAAWSAVDGAESDLRAISGLPTGEAWIVGANGVIRRVPAPSPAATPTPPPG